MSMTRKALFVAALVLTALVLAFGVSIVAGREDPTLEVAPVPVDRVGLNPSSATSVRPAQSVQPGGSGAGPGRRDPQAGHR